MKIASLASSSKGNAYLIADRNTRILLECGLSYKELQKRAGFDLARLHGCLVSHEHKDHSLSVRRVAENGIPIYMSRGTAEALELPETVFFLLEEIRAGEQFTVGTLDVMPFETYHDAAEPLGFLIQSKEDGDILAFATDTVNLPYTFPGVNILVVEANYEKGLLERCGRMPESTKHRIENTHMEIEKLLECLRGMDLGRCRQIYLCHLSDASGDEESFCWRVWKTTGIRTEAFPRDEKFKKNF